MTSNEVDAPALKDRFLAELPDAVYPVIERILQSAGDSGVYVVAGVVRDLLLGRAPVDVDLAIEGDALAVARDMAGDAQVVVHDRFLTATIDVGAHRVDLATARRESYERPGALPQVEPAGIEADLRRRDFAMNAIALRLNGAPAIVDPCDGVSDIGARITRVLHDGSFRDDATRIFRAFRYAARLEFTIEPHTRELLDDGVRYVGTIGGERLRHELHLLFEERSGGGALEGLDGAGALRTIHPALRWSPRATAALGDATQGAHRILVGFALLTFGVAAKDGERVVDRLQLSREEAAVVRAMASLLQSAAMLHRRDAKPSGIVAVLDRFPDAAVAAFGALSKDSAISTIVQRYLDQWRDVRPLLNGNDLLDMGIPEGPDIGKGLQLIRAARLDGWASDRDDERALALRFAKSIRDSRAMTQPIDFQSNGN
jgi:tRNA nucleotidyltransferase (CCA-adding enzyme)